VPSVGSLGDSHDNALAETINRLDQADVIWRQRSWPSVSAVEMGSEPNDLDEPQAVAGRSTMHLTPDDGEIRHCHLIHYYTPFA
jgi:hypothetical protein